MGEPLLQVKDLRLRFHTDQGVVEAIDGLGFTLERGEILGLVGESGCGKTATARCILRVVPTPPAEIVGGEIWFQGRDLLRLTEGEMARTIRGKAITFIPQDPALALNPLFPVGTQMRDILRWNADGAGRDRRSIRHRILTLLREVQIPSPEEQLRKFPHEFSGGQRQRLLIAMALSTNPALIIADEPTTALDVTIQAQILRLFKHLVREHGASVLFITHDLGVVSTLCDRVVVMYAGQEMETAPIQHLFERPAHPYTVKLLESRPDPEKREVKGIPGVVPSLINPPGGCRFHPRCDWAFGPCRDARPAPTPREIGHTVQCHLYCHPDAPPLALVGKPDRAQEARG